MDSEAIVQHIENARGRAEALFFTVWGKRDAMVAEAEAKAKAQELPLSLEAQAEVEKKAEKEKKHTINNLRSKFGDVFNIIEDQVITERLQSLDDLAGLIARRHFYIIQGSFEHVEDRKDAERQAAEADAIIGSIVRTLGIGSQERLIYAGLCRQSEAQKGEQPAP